MQKLLLTSLLLIAAVQISSAKTERKIQFRTLCTEQIEGIDKIVISGDGKKAKSQEVVLYADISPVIEGAFQTDEAVFFNEKPGADGELERVLVGKAKLGKSNRQLFVFSPNEDSESEMPYRVMAFDDDEKSFPMGHVRAINVASVPVRYIMAEKEQPEIAAGESAQFPNSTEVNEYNLYPVVVQYKNADGEWSEGKSSNWKASDKRREVAVTTYSADDKVLNVRLYSDMPPWRN